MTENSNCIKVLTKELTEAQMDFLKCCQELGWGKLEVTIQGGEPAFSRVIEFTHQHKKH